MVNTPIRIGITGAHSTGKTLLLRRIERELRAHGARVARTGRLGRRAADIGLPKMDQHTAQSTEWIIAQGIADEITAAAQGAAVVLADRAVVDALAYYHAALEFHGETAHPTDDERLRLLAGTRTRSTTCGSRPSWTPPRRSRSGGTRFRAWHPAGPATPGCRSIMLQGIRPADTSQVLLPNLGVNRV